MDIDNFSAAIQQGGLQKSSHFMVEIYPPAGLAVPYGNAIAHSYVRDVSLPGRNMVTSEIKYGSIPTTKQVYNSIPADCTINFMADGNMELFRFFQAWQKKIQDPLTGFLSYPDEYKGVVNIKTFDSLGNTTHEQKLGDAFPENLGDMQMSYGAEEIGTFSVTFSYTRVEDSPGAIGSGLPVDIAGNLLNLITPAITITAGPFSARIGF